MLNASLLLVVTTDHSDWLVQVDVVGPLMLNASLLLVVTTDYSDWLVHVTQLTDNWRWQNFFEFWQLCGRIILTWLIKLICWFLNKWNQVLKIKEMNECCFFVVFSLKFLTVLIF